MNPTSNKSDFEDLTTNLKDLAYSYLEKYNPSKQQLKVFLLKKYLTKIKGTKSKKEVTSIIEEIVSNLEKNKFYESINSISKDIKNDSINIWRNRKLKSNFIKKYGHLRPLTYSINSIMNQDFKDFEFLIMNDGSTDESSDILDSYSSDKRIKLFKNKDGKARSRL